MKCEYSLPVLACASPLSRTSRYLQVVSALLAGTGVGRPRSHHDSSLCERSFALTLSDEEGEETLWAGTFDRVVLFKRDGTPERAELIDFKTDQLADEAEVAARVEHYRPQLKAYAYILAKMTGLDISRIESSLLFLTIDRVCPV